MATPGKPCAPGIWPLAHTLGGVWGPGSSGVSPRCGVDSKVAVREHIRGTQGSSLPQPNQLWRPRSPSLEPFALALHPIPASVCPPGPTRGGLLSGKSHPEPQLSIRPLGEKKKIPWPPPCSPRRSPHLTPRAAHLGHTGGKRATSRGHWGETATPRGSQPGRRTRR